MTEIICVSALNGLLYGMLLFLTAGGLTLIFGMTGILNFAHASFYMLGAYLGFEISRRLNFWAGLFVGPLLVATLGGFVEHFLLRKVHRQGHAAELLFTFGLAIVVTEAVQMVWGRTPADYRIPQALDFVAFRMFDTNYPAYRMFMLLIAISMFLFLMALLFRSRLGLVVQAALTHPHTVALLGHDVPRIFTSIFALGCGLAALAGVIAGPALVTQPDMGASLGPLLFVVVVIGGLGSLPGAFAAAVMIGMLQTGAVAINASLATVFGDASALLPSNLARLTIAQIAPILPYLLLVIMLVVRPRGLMGKR